jgi:hypothetical protein
MNNPQRNQGTWRKLILFALALPLFSTLLSHSTLLASDPPVTTGRWFSYDSTTTNYPSASNVSAMAEDSKGRLWIGTDKIGGDGVGVALFDGFAWTAMTTANTGGALRSDTVYSIRAIGDTMWIGGPNGVSTYNVASNQWGGYSIADGLPTNDIRVVALQTDGLTPGIYHFGTSDKGVVLCNLIVQQGQPIDCSQSETLENGKLPGNLVWDIATHGNERWIVTSGGVVHVHTPPVPPGGAETRTTYTAGTPGCPDIDRANRVALDYEHNRVWVTLGAFVFNEFDPIANPGRGACVFDTVAGTWRDLNAGNSGIGEDDVVDVAIDREGRAWFGALGDQPGLFVYTWVTDTCCWQTYRTNTPGAQMLSNSVRTVYAGLDRVWFGHLDSLSSLALHWQAFDNDVTALASLPGALWVGTANNVSTFDGTTFTPVRTSINVRDILALAANNVWVASASGLHHWNGNVWRQFTTANSGIASNNVSAVAQDQEGRIWATTLDKGVSVFNGSGNNWATFDTNNVLPHNIARDIVVDPAGVVWIATNGGVSQFNGTHWRNFTQSDGLPALAVSTVGVDASGNVWAGTQAGAALWDGIQWASFASQMPALDVQTLYGPATGGMWFAVVGGALFHDGSGWDYYRASNSGLTHAILSAITNDSTGAVWFGGLDFSGAGSGPGGLFVRSVNPEPLGVEVPGISSIAPTSGPAGTEVTITGSGFQPGSQVFFGASGGSNGAVAQIVSFSGTSIVARVPAEAVTGKVRVTNVKGSATSTENFLPQPVITSLSINTGPVGSPLLLTGTNLADINFTEIKFGNSAYNSQIIFTTKYNLIEAVVPADATNGPVKIRTEGGEATGPDFTLSGGGLKLIDYEVHQGLPQYTKLVAGKSTVVRLFLGSDAPSGCAYVSGATLQLLGPGGSHVNYAETLDTGGIPNKGFFCGVDKQHATGGSIDFVIPGESVPQGMTNLAVSFSARNVTLLNKVLGNYPFESTDDLRVHIAAPGWDVWDDTNIYGPMQPAELGSTLFNRQILNFNRIYPVRDGTGDMLSENGLRYLVNPIFTLCNGVDDGFCGNASDTYNFLYDFWQEDPNGILRYCMVQTRFPSNAKDDGSVMRWKYGELKPGAQKRMDFIVSLRPGVSMPADPFSLISINTGSAELVVTQPSVITSFTGPMGCPTMNEAGLFMYRFTVKNEGTTTFTDHTIAVDYQESALTAAANGGMVLGSGGTPATYVQKGKFFIIDGAQGDMFDPPMDMNYNGVIDNTDKTLFIAEFDDWNPALGIYQRSTNLGLVSPRDVLRNFIDKNGNQAADTDEQWAPSLERHRDKYVRYAVYDVPRNYMNAFNATSPVDAQFSQLWIWNRINPMGFMGLGGQAPNNVSMWALMGSHTAILHETGHNVGLQHSITDIPNIPAGYNTFERRVVLGDKLKSSMADPVVGPVEEVFFNPLQYHHVFTFFRNQFSASVARSAGTNATPVIYVAGLISQNGEVQINASYRSEELPTTPIDPAGDYWLRLMGDDGVLADYRFGVQFEVEDLPEGESQPQTAPFAITQPWVEGTRSVEIWDNDEPLFQLPVSASPPSVVVQSPNGGESIAANGTLTVKWSGSDPDGDALSYAVYYSPDGGTTWLILAASTSATQVAVPAALLPGSANALVMVIATDGVHTASDAGNGAFQVAGKGPQTVSILAPAEGELLVQSQIQTLVGAAYDLEDGQLSGNALAWNSDLVGALGTGESVTVTLPVGVHVLTLEATDSANLKASASITVEVLADFDGDGLADSYEEQYGELAWWNPDDAGADPDNDGLTSRSEAAWGTDPGNADSDGDGVNDGDEANAGALPTDATSKPTAPRVLASAQTLSFSMAAGETNPAPVSLLLMSSTPADIAWTASVEGSWLKVDANSGSTPDEVTISVDGSKLGVGAYQGAITFQGGAGAWTIPVTLKVADPSTPEMQMHLPTLYR